MLGANLARYRRNSSGQSIATQNLVKTRFRGKFADKVLVSPAILAKEVDFGGLCSVCYSY